MPGPSIFGMAPSLKSRRVAVFFFAMLLSCSAIPVRVVPQEGSVAAQTGAAVKIGVGAYVCRYYMSGHDSDASRSCCLRYGLGCDAVPRHEGPGVLHVDAGQPSAPAAPKPPRLAAGTLRLGDRCVALGKVQCRNGHECRDGICRRKVPTAGSTEAERMAVAARLFGDDTPRRPPTDAERAAMAARQIGESLPPRRPPRTGEAVAAAPAESQPAIEVSGLSVSGLSVPLDARVPIGSAFAGREPLLPKVSQRMRKPVQPVVRNSVSAQAALAAEGDAYVLAPAGDTAGEKGKMCPEKATLKVGVSGAGAGGAVDAGVGSSSADAAAPAARATDEGQEETEDEQISDSVAKVVERMAGVKVDEKLLSALDAAVTKTMDNYEEKAAQTGELLIDVDELTKGTSTKVKITLPDTEPPVGGGNSGGGDTAADEATLEARTDASVGDQVVAAVRDKLAAEMDAGALDRLASALVSATKCRGPAALKLTRAERKNCDLAQWVRANWLQQGGADAAPAAAQPQTAPAAAQPQAAPATAPKVPAAPAAAVRPPPAPASASKPVYVKEL